MKVHNNIKDLLASFSIAHHKWLNTVSDTRTFNEVADEYLSENTLKEINCTECNKS